MLASKYFPINTKTQKPVKNRILRGIDDFMEGLLSKLDNALQTGLSGILDYKLHTILGVLILVLGTLYYIPKLGFNLMPSIRSDNVRLSVSLPQGSTREQTEEVLNDMYDIITREIRGYREVIVTSGGGGGFFGGSSTNSGSIMINLPPYNERIDDSDAIRTKLRPFLNRFPDARVSLGGGGFSISGDADIIVKSNDTEKERRLRLRSDAH